MGDSDDQMPDSLQRMPEEEEEEEEEIEDRSEWTYFRLGPEIEDVEDLADYRPGGFAPLDLGDILDERFEIFKKLGSGGCAIVWLCWELATGKWYAVKVNTAENSSEDCSDLMVLKRFQELGVSREEAEANHVVLPYESFWIESPNGRHFCTVLPVLGPRLSDWRTLQVKDNTELAKKLCYQTAEGLSFLHSRGICHGDFRPQNILMKLETGIMDGKSKEQIYNLLGMQDISGDVWTTKRTRSKHAPRKVVQPLPWGLWQPVVEESIVIVDFGEAFKTAEPVERYGIPPAYASPEVLFSVGTQGPKSDVWSLAVTLLELRLDRWGGGKADDAIRTMERFVGPVPPYYREAAREILESFEWDLEEDSQGSNEATGSLKPLTGPLDVPRDMHERRDAEGLDFTHPLEQRLGTEQTTYGQEPDPNDPTGVRKRVTLIEYYLSRDEVLEFADLLKKMLKYMPDDRISAAEVLSHSWFRKQRPVPPKKSLLSCGIPWSTSALRLSCMVSAVLRIPWAVPVLVAFLSTGIWVAWPRCLECGTLNEAYKSGRTCIGNIF